MSKRTGTLLSLGLLLAGCFSEEDGATPLQSGEGLAQVTLRLHVVDLWGGPLPLARCSVDGSAEVELGPAGELDVPLTLLPAGPGEDEQVWQLRVEGPQDWLPAEVRIGRRAPLRASCTGSGSAATALAEEPDVPGRRHLFIGLDHRWFAASGRAPCLGCTAELLMDGEELWGAVHHELQHARREVLWTTWWWQSDFELVRPPDTYLTLSREQRLEHSVMELLDRPGLRSRVLVNHFLGNSAEGTVYLNTDRALRDRARDPEDGLEAMVQANPTQVPVQDLYPRPPLVVPFLLRLAARPELAHLTFSEEPATRQQPLVTADAASWHQKMVVVDREVGFVVGMNTKSSDWDTSEHRVFEPRRMLSSSTVEERQAVQQGQRLPDLVPRKDYGMRITGKAVGDLVDVFALRWEESRRVGAPFADRTTPLERSSGAPPSAGNMSLQVQATLPAPFFETSILESHRKAIAEAREYIYIEDQYFRAPLLQETLLRSLEEHPDLHLVVVTLPLSAADGGKKYSWEVHRALRDAFPERYLLLQAKSFELGSETLPGAHFVPIYLHSKLMLVDDRYLSVGSCNKNNRGYLYEGELNVSVLDGELGRSARERIVANLLGPGSESVARGGFAEVFGELKRRAEANAQVEAFWASRESAGDASGDGERRPVGFVYPLDFDGEYLLEVGPDAF